MIKFESKTISDYVYSGVIHGIWAWTIYAIVECCFSSILTWLVKPNYAYVALHFGFTALLFVIYPLIGLIIGGLCGLGFHVAVKRIQFLQRINPMILFQTAATFTVILAFDLNLVFQLPITNSSVLLSLLVSILLIIALAFRAGSIIGFKRLGFPTNPWAACVLLVGLMWIIKEVLDDYSSALKAGCVLTYLVAILLISFFVQKMVETRRTGRSTGSVSASLTRSIALLTPIVFLVLGVSFFLEQAPIRETLNLKSSSLSTGNPNVILITMDTVRSDHLSLYGYERDTTPNIRKLTKEATLYTRAISAGDMTLPSHASIFTGMYARQHGTHYDPWSGHPGGRALPDKFHTIAEILSEAGYLTSSIVANYAFLTNDFGFNQGFQYYDQRMPIIFLGQTRAFYIRQGIRNILIHFASTPTFDRLYRTAEEINKEVFNILNNVQKDDKPFFVFINYMDAHEPYLPPTPFDTLYPGKDEKFTSDYYRSMEKEVMQLKRKATENERNHLISQYDGGIAYIDLHIGKLIGKLKELSLYENTLIIITSDHGETFGERNLVGHGVSVYQDQIHIPLIIKYPNIDKADVVDELVSSIDIMPTILEVLGHDISEDVQGKSLVKIDPWQPREVISESFPYGGWIDWHPRFDRVERAIFSGSYKFISSTDGKKELYDLEKDPNEKKNLYNANDNKSIALETKLVQWLKDVKEESGSAAKLSKEALGRLKALGYVQ